MTRRQLEDLGDELAALFIRAERHAVYDAVMGLPKDEAVFLMLWVHQRLLGFQHSTSAALLDIAGRRIDAQAAA